MLAIMRYLCFLVSLLMWLAIPSAAQTATPCGVELDSLSVESALPGEKFQLRGSWGLNDGKKLPVINLNGQNELEVIEWSEAVLTVRVPEGLRPGKYKVGVYCHAPSLGSSFSSGFKTFEVKGLPLKPAIPIP
ncbi:MAG: hypothetical protein KDD62_08735, partial [Bdellovibrionales bacterium]|nr:hypothetical protein [Bdellovibrionales bacterium]